MARSLTEDREYFSKRAKEELIAAATCEDNSAARAHLNLADQYRKRVDLIADKMVEKV